MDIWAGVFLENVTCLSGSRVFFPSFQAIPPNLSKPNRLTDFSVIPMKQELFVRVFFLGLVWSVIGKRPSDWLQKVTI